MRREFRQRASDAMRFYAEISRRVSAAGVNGIGGLLGLHGQLEQALREVSSREVEWALEQIKGVLDEMIRIDSELRYLREIILALDVKSPPEEFEIRERASG